jgi:hypothetical protein
MTDDSDDALQNFIRFSKRGFIPDDDRERWGIETCPPKEKRTRKRRVTLSHAMQQASEAGVAVSNATINADGSVTLALAGLKDRRSDPDEAGRRQAEAVHRARLARRATESTG